MANIFDFTDYREFLKNAIAEKKRENPVFSYRYISRKTGFKSAGHFSLILHGKVNLSMKYFDGFVSLLGLKSREAEYFKAMVMYNQSKRHEDKSMYFKKMVSFREFKFKMINEESYRLFEKWYYVAVREVLSYCNFMDNYRKLSKMIMPEISPVQAREAVEVLLDIGMVRRNSEGILERVDRVLSTGTETPTVVLGNFLESTMDIAKDSLYKIPRHDRTISWATVSVSKETFKEIREELRAFRQRILKKAREDSNPQQVYHFSINGFPITRQSGDGNE